MKIRSISGRTIRLISSAKTVEEFKRSVDVGEVVKGRIVELFQDNKALVSFKGFDLIAETNILFKKGDVFFAQVKAKEPKITLKVLPFDREKIHKFTDQDAIEIIHHLGKREDDKLIQIIKGLIRYRVPITKKTVEELQIYLSQLEGKADENIKALLFMRENGIKITPQNVSFVKSYLFGRLNIAKNLRDFLTILQTIKLEGQEEILGFVKGILLNTEEGLCAERIKEFLDRVGFGWESMLFEMFQRNAHERKSFEQRYFKRNLKFELLKLITSERIKGSLKEVVSKLLEDIFAMQVVSTAKGEDSYLYIQLPIYLADGKIGLVELKVYYDKEKKHSIDPHNFRFHITLRTTKLGVVEVDVTLHKELVDISFRMEDELKDSFIASKFPTLLKNLEGLGYKIAHLSSIVAPKKEGTFEDEKEIWKVGRIDFRV